MNPEPSSERALEELRVRLAAERGWRGRLRSLSTPVRLLAGLLILALTAVGVGALLRRPDFPVYPRLLMAASLLLLAVLALLSVRVVLRPLQTAEPGRVAAGLLMLLGLGVPVALALLPEAHAFVHEHPESFAGRGADLWPRAARCLAFGMLLSSPLLLWVWLADRRERWSPARLALAAAGAGLGANLYLLLHCPLVAREHLLAGHASTGIVLLLGLGAAAWARARRRRAPPAGAGM